MSSSRKRSSNQAPMTAPKRRKITPGEHMKIMWEQGYRCADCQQILHHIHDLDHKIALSLQGPDTLENLQCLCLLCHRKKTLRDAQELSLLRKNKRIDLTFDLEQMTELSSFASMNEESDDSFEILDNDISPEEQEEFGQLACFAYRVNRPCRNKIENQKKSRSQ